MDLKDAGLIAVNPLDGRYRQKVAGLGGLVSEAGLIRYRIRVEGLWLQYLLSTPPVAGLFSVAEPALGVIRQISDDPPADAPERVKAIEATTNHDVKAVEYYIRDLLADAGAPAAVLAMIHFACTSEDINNLAYGLMLRDVRSDQLLPFMDDLLADLDGKIRAWHDLPMLSRTHGQTASPTTLGKELAVFASRLRRQRDQLADLVIPAKMSGAVGNYNAHMAAFPDLNWADYCREFIDRIPGLEQNRLTTQIENHDGMIEYTDTVRRFNVILLGMCRDLWGYISLGYFSQAVKEGEVGSSTMPHKVNPIDFENAEGNLGVANALASHYAEKLPVSRWQRDLTDSTVQRTLGTFFGHTVLALQSALKGLGRIEARPEVIAADLDEAWEVLAEPVQTVMRRYGIGDAYERLKAATRGKAVTRETIHTMLDGCPELPEEARNTLKAMAPATYTGAASALALEFVKQS